MALHKLKYFFFFLFKMLPNFPFDFLFGPQLFRSILSNFHIFGGFQGHFCHCFLIELHCCRRTYLVGIESFLTLLRLISWTRRGLHVTCITWKECVICCPTNVNQVKLVNNIFQIFEHSQNFVILFHQLLRKEYWNIHSVQLLISFCFIYFDTLVLGSLVVKIFMSSQKINIFYYYIVILLSQVIFCCSEIYFTW